MLSTTTRRSPRGSDTCTCCSATPYPTPNTRLLHTQYAALSIAHELSHLNLAVSNGYNQPQADVLLADYPCLLASTRDEAWADVCGTLGVLQTGLVDSAAICQHISQAWVRAHARGLQFRLLGAEPPKSQHQGRRDLCDPQETGRITIVNC